jgi:hypothetical protein
VNSTMMILNCLSTPTGRSNSTCEDSEESLFVCLFVCLFVDSPLVPQSRGQRIGCNWEGVPEAEPPPLAT